MDLTLSPSEEAFRDELRVWLEDNHPGAAPEDEDEAFEFSPALAAQAARRAAGPACRGRRSTAAAARR